MKTQLLAAAAALALMGAASAATGTLDFGTLSAGTDANTLAPSGTMLAYANLVQDTDINGDPIPGAFSWKVDSSAGTTLVQDPSVRGHGTGPIALDAVDQPILLIFPTTGDLVSFSGVLDHGPLSGGLPSQNLVFADYHGKPVGSLALDYTQPGLSFSTGPISGVREVILPSGRYIEKISFVAAPEVNGQAMIGALALAGAVVLRRWKR